MCQTTWAQKHGSGNQSCELLKLDTEYEGCLSGQSQGNGQDGSDSAG
jgi:hypothetical protein